MMSPALPSSMAVRSRPRKPSTFDTRPCSTSFAVAAQRLHGHVRLHHAIRHAPCQEPAEEWVRLDGCRQHPKVARRPLSAAGT